MIFEGFVYVSKKVSECIACSHKNDSLWPATLPPLRPIPITPKAMWRIHIDLLGPLTQTLNGNTYIALGVCSLIKFVEGMGNIYKFNYSSNLL